jgi:hypothetical protein
MRFFIIVLLLLFTNIAYSYDNYGIGKQESAIIDTYITTWDEIIRSIGDNLYKSDKYLYLIKPKPALCIKGRLTPFAKDRALNTLNAIRKLHNLQPLKYSSKYDGQVQAGALILEANGIITHTPSKKNKCYTDEGYDGTSSSNVYGGRGSISERTTHDPLNDILGWVHDTYNLNDKWRLGHRRWDLDPFRTYMSYGQVYWASLDKVHGFTEEKEITVDPKDIPDFVAFPYKRYPYVLFPVNKDRFNTYWSFQMVEDKSNKNRNKHYYFTNAKISIKEKYGLFKKSLPVKNIWYDVENYGVPNLLSWIVEGWDYNKWYIVKISDITMKNGEKKTVSYDVFIDTEFPSKILPEVLDKILD